MKLHSDLKGNARLGHVYELDFIEFKANALGQIRAKKAAPNGEKIVIENGIDIN